MRGGSAREVGGGGLQGSRHKAGGVGLRRTPRAAMTTIRKRAVPPPRNQIQSRPEMRRGVVAGPYLGGVVAGAAAPTPSGLPQLPQKRVPRGVFVAQETP